MKSSRLGIIELARICGVSKTTISAALGSSGRVSDKVRQKVQEEARRLGWHPDPHLSQLMGYLRQSRKQNAVCNLAWLNTSSDPRRWHDRAWFCGYWKGAQLRAEALGYHLGEIWTRGEGVTAGTVSRMLKARGVAGVLLPLPEDQPLLHELKKEMCAWVVIDEAELELPFPRIQADRHHNMRLLLEETKKLGYRNPAFFCDPYLDRISQHTYSSAYLGWCWEMGKTPKLGSSHPGTEAKDLNRLCRKTKPDLIIASDNRMVKWCEEGGLKVPQNLGVTHLNLAADVKEWAGIVQQHEQIGALAVDHLVSLVTTRQFGSVPQRSIQVPGEWKLGRTVRKMRD